MEQPKKTCLQCKECKSVEEYFIYKKSGRPYSWCKECVRDSSHRSEANHVARSKVYRERWGAHAI